MKNKLRGILIIGVLLGLAALAFVFFPRNPARRNALAARSLATQFLAEYLASKHPGKRVLIIANPFTQQKGRRAEIYQFEQAGIDGLRRGFGKQLPIEAIGFPKLRREVLENPVSVHVDAATTTPLSFLIAENSFDALAQKHPTAEILVSLIGLPKDVTQSELWKTPKTPTLGLLLPDWRIIGGSESVKQAFESGKISAAILNKPGAPAEDVPLGQDERAAFAARFLLVTLESIDELLRQHPKLF